MPMLHRLDQTFKAKRINPGTTADLTVATLLVVFLEKLI
jgi:triphosphoribosyl-dephospho-CoA synthase